MNPRVQAPILQLRSQLQPATPPLENGDICTVAEV